MLRDANPSKEVVVVIPVYREEMLYSEQLCLKRNIDILSSHTIVLVSPVGLDLKNYLSYGRMSFEYFDKKYFNGLSGYNRFMLSTEFYERFIEYQYILICQLDAFVFSDQLNYWCNKDFDYIGAPWINKPLRILSYFTVKVGFQKTIQLLLTGNFFSAVGNGGFSLRKTARFLSSLKENKEAAESWKANEDYYWSFFAKIQGKALLTPKVEEASEFCIEMDASKILKKSKFKLPFAIHAWQRHDPNTWKPFLNELGYDF
jgi:hypothetical protein